MHDDREALIAQAVELYEPIVRGAANQIVGGKCLWGQFGAAVDAARSGQEGAERQLRERINELATAKFLADDETISGNIAYEPKILPSGRKIDFVVERSDDRLYVEVKSVYPNAPETDANWTRYLQLRKFHPENVNFIVKQDWMGGKIYGNTFAARSKFLDYALAFEKRLAEAKQEVAGPGILVFCGSGFHWHVSDLEDFSDFYHSGHHRSDDPFARMEQHEIERKGISLKGNIDYFAFLKRKEFRADPTRMHFPVSGPEFGR